jgi:hypothetical protein
MLAASVGGGAFRGSIVMALAGAGASSASTVGAAALVCARPSRGGNKPVLAKFAQPDSALVITNTAPQRFGANSITLRKPNGIFPGLGH